MKIFPNFRYQISFIDPERFENHLKDRDAVSRVFRSFFRPKPQEPRPADYVPRINALDRAIDAFVDIPRSEIVTEEELEYYVDHFMKGTFHGPCNWYRTRVNAHLDEKEYVFQFLQDLNFNK